MSSAVVSTPAALGRPFVFEDEAELESGLPSSARRVVLDRTAEGGCPHINLKQVTPESRVAHVFQSAINNQKSAILSGVTPASQLEIRPAPEMVSSGVPAIDALTGGLPRGCLTEICGPASSGRTTLLLAALAAATRRGEFCAVVDASDALDPHSAAASGVELDHLLWVRCGEDAPQKSHSKPGCPISRAPFAREVGTREVHSQAAFDFDTGFEKNSSRQSEHRLEQVLRATDLLLESGGFGLIVLDLGDLPPQAARRIPLTTWFRYRRAIEHTPTILLAIEQHPIAGSCSSLLLKLRPSEQSNSSPAGAAYVSPEPALSLSKGRKSWVAKKIRNESRRACPEQAKRAEGDGTELSGEDETTYETPTAPQIVQPTHTHLLTGLEITAELIRSRLDRKPARSVAFATKTAWAG